MNYEERYVSGVVARIVDGGCIASPDDCQLVEVREKSGRQYCVIDRKTPAHKPYKMGDPVDLHLGATNEKEFGCREIIRRNQLPTQRKKTHYRRR